MEPIRVLHILHSINRGGAENAIMNYYRHVDRETVQFDFLLTEQARCQFEDEIDEMGGRVFRVPLMTMKNPFPYLRGVKDFLRSHPEYKIVHSHTSSKSYFPLSVAKRVGVPVRISHSHGSRSESGLRGRIRDSLKPLLRKVATHFFACGHDPAVWLYGKKMLDEGKVMIFPNVIETERFVFDNQMRESVRGSLGIKDSTVVIGCTARFHPVKNHSFLISMFNEFHKSVKDSILLLVGDGELRDDVEKQINSFGITDSVHFAGVVSNVADFEQAMDFFLLPSLFEGLPLSLIEAQISGLRCYTSEGVPREADITGLVSFLPLEKGPGFWAETIAKEIGYERRSRVEDICRAGYDAETSAIKLEQFYLEAYLKVAQ